MTRPRQSRRRRTNVRSSPYGVPFDELGQRGEDVDLDLRDRLRPGGPDDLDEARSVPNSTSSGFAASVIPSVYSTRRSPAPSVSVPEP